MIKNEIALLSLCISHELSFGVNRLTTGEITITYLLPQPSRLAMHLQPLLVLRLSMSTLPNRL